MLRRRFRQLRVRLRRRWPAVRLPSWLRRVCRSSPGFRRGDGELAAQAVSGAVPRDLCLSRRVIWRRKDFCALRRLAAICLGVATYFSSSSNWSGMLRTGFRRAIFDSIVKQRRAGWAKEWRYRADLEGEDRETDFCEWPISGHAPGDENGPGST